MLNINIATDNIYTSQLRNWLFSYFATNYSATLL